MGEMKNTHKIFITNPEAKRLLGRPRHGWEDIRMVLWEIGLGDVNWTHLAQDRDQSEPLMNMVMNPDVP
jgi:hypothetical protein